MAGLEALKKEVVTKAGKYHGKGFVLFLDYDGTIVPIRRVPSSAVISRGSKALIKKAAGTQGLKVCVVTGRSLENIRGILDIKGLSYIGNHGLEVWFDGRSWSPSAKGTKGALGRMLKAVKRELYGIKGVIIEDKGLSFSVHYRNVRAAGVPKVKEAASSIKPKGVRLREGKKVIEARPDIDWDKGKGVLKWLNISKSSDSIQIYLGDDLTDEDAFRELKRTGLTVKVGAGKTIAKYRVRGLREVHSFIRFIISLVEKTTSKSA